MTEPLRLSFEVDCRAEHAFRTWVERISDWWPRSHTTRGEEDVDVVLEPRVGGRLFERSPAGAETDWGEVTAWEPPHRLGYLWHLRRDRADATDVELRFLEQPDGTTRIEIEHTGWQRLGAGGPAWRERNNSAWQSLFPYFKEAAER